MICTSCSRQVKPIVALDIDGTLGDYHGHFVRFAEGYLGRKIPDGYDGGLPFGAWFTRAARCDLDTFRAAKLAYRQGGLKRTMPCHRGSAPLVSDLRAAGAEVWITTTRPYLKLDAIDPDTREWLRRNGIVYDHILYAEDKMLELSQQIDPARVVGVLDDLPEVYDRAEHLFGRLVPLLKLSQYNEASADGRRFVVQDLDAASRILQARINRWMEDVA